MTKGTWHSTNPHDNLRSNWNNTTGAKIQPREVFAPGTIIRAFVYEEALAKGQVAGPSIMEVPGRDPLCAKNHFLIVVAQHEGNYICLPLYTHNGKGLENKQFKNEYVSVQDHRNRQPGFVKQGPHQPLLTYELSRNIKIDDKTTARLTYPLSRDYNLPVTLEGCLDDASTKSLVRLYNMYAPSEAKLKSRRTAVTGGGRLGGANAVVTRLSNLRIGTGVDNAESGASSVTGMKPGGALVRGRAK